MIMVLGTVNMGSVSSKGYYCPKHGFMSCPICGSKLVRVEYRGNKPRLLALMKRADFICFLVCKRVDLHDKIVDGVNYRDKVFVRPIFKD